MNHQPYQPTALMVRGGAKVTLAWRLIGDGWRWIRMDCKGDDNVFKQDWRKLAGFVLKLTGEYDHTLALCFNISNQPQVDSRF